MKSKIQAQLQDVVSGVHRLILFREIRRDPVVASLLGAVDALGGETQAAAAVFSVYDALGHLLQERVETNVPRVVDLWTDHLLNLVIFADNPFSRQLAAAKEGGVDPEVLAAGIHDLRQVQEIAQAGELLPTHQIQREVEEAAAGLAELIRWDSYWPQGDSGFGSNWSNAILKLKKRFLAAEDWAQCVEHLSQFWQVHGVGAFARFPAFRWLPGQNGADRDALVGVSQPDPIRLESLVGYEEQKRLVVENTERLIRGLPAQNLLLYGDRGTGKSSLVKALVNEFADQGLRLVEVSKAGMASIYRLTDRLRRHRNPFIIFIDDLSFEETEVQYKELKGLLEGSIESQPAKVRLYVTTNRRHLVRERLSDTPEPGASDEVRAKDTVEEKLSLADRFGMTVVFPSPDQAKYLAIVDSLAKEAGIQLPKQELHARALRWTMWNNARSGRTARQFVDSLIGSDPV